MLQKMRSKKILKYLNSVLLILGLSIILSNKLVSKGIEINSKGYFEKDGLNVMVMDDYYPEGHQGGITIIQHGKRVATNGNLALEPTPGQWQPYPKVLDKKIDRKNDKIKVSLQFPDSSRMKSADQPIIYPDLKLKYNIVTRTKNDKIEFIVNLNKPIPEKWVGQVGFNLELYPAELFGKTYYMDKKSGLFPRYSKSPVKLDQEGEYEPIPMAEGEKLTIAPATEKKRITIKSKNTKLKLYDGRVKHKTGWYVVRSLIPKGATKSALKWTIDVNTIQDWKYEPVVHVSQLGYHPNQEKRAIIELDKNHNDIEKVNIQKIKPSGGIKTVKKIEPVEEKHFLRYDYYSVDFSDINNRGIYRVKYGDVLSNKFRISKEIYDTGTWQPTLEYFLPVQMCHMKVFEKVRVWHDRCHLDDALLAPENINHFDVYTHGEVPEDMTPLEHIEGLDKGGWHDAGDYDFRIESQIGTILALAYAYEEFNVDHDQTLVNQDEKVAEIHHPDGKADVLQQIEHGLLTVLGGYEQLGELYRGILCPTLRQYPMLGDAGSMTDNKVYKGEKRPNYSGFWYNKVSNQYSKRFSPQNSKPVERDYIKNLDDRLVFLEDEPNKQIYGVSGLAAAARVMKDYDKKLSEECLQTAEELWNKFHDEQNEGLKSRKVYALTELILTTDKEKYEKSLIDMLPYIKENLYRVGWIVGRVMDEIDNEEFKKIVNSKIIKVEKQIDAQSKENPFNIPYHPNIWGAGWGIQKFGFRHYFLNKSWPEVFSPEPMINALNFVLGLHPGQETQSFVSNVGTKSQTVAYGVNRADWSFIPGGVCSGTNIIRPDLPELKQWPFLWQQAEYVMGGGATHYMFLALAVENYFK